MTNQELKNKLLDIALVKDNQYLDNYVNIIINNLDRPRENFKTQKHHIIPRYYYKYNNLKLDNSKNNLVNLLYVDHALAHYNLLMCSTSRLFEYCNLLVLNYSNLNINKLNLDFETLNNIQIKYEELSNLRYKLNPMFNKELKDKHDKIMASEDVRSKISNTMRIKYQNGELFSDEHRKNLSKSSKGKIYINKDEVYTTIFPEELDYYLSQGWVKGGKKLSLEHKQALINSHLGKKYSDELILKLSLAHKGKSPANKGVPSSEETKQKLRKQFLGRKWVNNGIIQKQVKQEELSNYLNNEFVLGTLPKKVGDKFE